MTPEEQVTWLRSRGWHSYYNENYWVHPKTVADPKQQDYTNYGMSAEDAIAYERIGCPPHEPMGSPWLSRIRLAIKTHGLTQRGDI